MNENKVIKYDPAMDIIRCLALFLVISNHFFWKSQLLDQVVSGKRMFCMVVMFSLTLICVPLFITLTGFLMRKKTLQRSFYFKITKTLVIYTLASIACVIYANQLLGHIPLKYVILGFFNFSDAPYAWYIEMYIGLFMLIPFLNILYNNLPSKQWKLVLIITLIILTALPTVVNTYNLDIKGWWMNPAMDGNYRKLMPAWWNGIYPLTYYFIGCYLSEYRPKIRFSTNICLIVLVLTVFSVYNYWRSHGSSYIVGTWSNWESIFAVLLTILVFLLFINRNYERISLSVISIFRLLSGLCLGGYLVSWIFDEMIYEVIYRLVPDVFVRLNYFFLVVPLIFICSLCLSFLLDCIYRLGEHLIKQ